MSRVEVLCVTMKNDDLREQYRKMNIQTDVVFANQHDRFEKEKFNINENRVVVITTDTRGNGMNRNIALLAASDEICLLSDDDMAYVDGYEKIITDEFDKHPDYDVIIFNIGTSTPQYNRIPKVVTKEGWMGKYSKNPFGAPRIAFRLSAVRKSNQMFSLLFGGGSMFSNGQDSLFLRGLLDCGLRVWKSTKFIGDVSFEGSSWFAYDERKKAYGKGALIQAQPIHFKFLYSLYFAKRFSTKTFGFFECLKWISNGRTGYDNMMSYDEYIISEGEK